LPPRRSNYRGLLAKLGMTDHAQLQDRFDVTVLLWPNESRFPAPALAMTLLAA
jgi:hypothetical protein